MRRLLVALPALALLVGLPAWLSSETLEVEADPAGPAAGRAAGEAGADFPGGPPGPEGDGSVGRPTAGSSGRSSGREERTGRASGQRGADFQGGGWRMPWREAGLSEAQAAAHLLGRLTFGPRPGEVEVVMAQGLEAWFEAQLAANGPSPELDRRLSGLDTLAMSDRALATAFPNPGLMLIQAVEEGVVRREDLEALRAARESGDSLSAEQRQARREVMRWAQGQGFWPQRELYDQLTAQKLSRAVYSTHQLETVMTDFWFNHFNVSLTDNEVRPYLLAYERDAIRRHALGSVRELLEATARHPAMLLYLDNARSGAEEGVVTTLDLHSAGGIGRSGRRGRGELAAGGSRGGLGARRGSAPMQRRQPSATPRRERPTGLNENYARELLELHTLGVDGGYDQHDIVEVARAFSGWSLVPPGQRGQEALDRLSRVRRAGGAGFVVDGLFLFRADRHDAEAKVVLGHQLPAGRGIEDGEEVLDVLAAHPATAHHLATKLAIRFVSDEPPPALVDRLAESYRSGGGDVRMMLRTLVASPEFWEARGQKVKSPYELAVSALRALGADVEDPRAVVAWVSRMGQPLYAYQAPTGYPDREEFWINTGSLLNRMSFGLELAAGRIDGLRFDLEALAGGREPESHLQALETYAPILLPQRDVAETVALLEPMVRDPQLARKLEGALPQEGPAGSSDDASEDLFFAGSEPVRSIRRPREEAPSAVAQVVGVILGSPEFQRR